MSFDKKYLRYFPNPKMYCYTCSGLVGEGTTPESAYHNWTVKLAAVQENEKREKEIRDDTFATLSAIAGSSVMYNDPPGSEPVSAPSPSPDFGSGGGGDFGGGGATGDW